MTDNSFSGLFSHPGKPLEKHLLDTGDLAASMLEQERGDNLAGRFNLKKEQLVELARQIGCCHDVGKATNFFQTYLLTGEKEKRSFIRKPETSHSLFSAIYTFFITKDLISSYSMLEQGRQNLLSFFLCMVVKNHHGDLGDAIIETALDEKKEKLLLKQLDHIDAEKFNKLGYYLKETGVSFECDKKIIREWILEASETLGRIRREIRQLKREKSLDYYLFTNFFYSLLIDADKSEVVIGKGRLIREQREIPPAVVHSYKKTLSFKYSEINRWREEAFQETLTCDLKIKEKNIYSLNLPTGMGKTFAALAFALKLREKCFLDSGYMPRIIYALPFLSIIEQNARVFEEILETAGFKVDSSLLLKHHHLAEVYYRQNDDEFEDAQAQILLEGWNSEIIITTFYQVFHTLFSNRNKMLRKFHRFSGSIFILDEVQSVPFKYWLLVKRLFLRLGELLDSKVLLVTATEPAIFSEGTEDTSVKLVNREKYFSLMNRVILKADVEKRKTITELAEGIVLEDGKSKLFIFNTVASAREFFEKMDDIFPDVEKSYLSTHVTPCERMKRISDMKDKKIKLAITTQVVEAGVDIDFDVVIRDLAPIDSISQAAGRCNRHGKGKGEVLVVSLINEQGRNYASYVYDHVLLDVSYRLLKERQIFKESDFFELVEKYYKQLLEKKSSEESEQLLESIFYLKYEGEGGEGLPGISDFRLIENDYPKIDVFVEIDEHAKKVWEKYLEIKEIENIWERRAAFQNFRNEFYSYTVSIPLNVENLPPEVEGFRYVNSDSLRDYYHPATGFKIKGAPSIW